MVYILWLLQEESDVWRLTDETGREIEAYFSATATSISEIPDAVFFHLYPEDSNGRYSNQPVATIRYIRDGRHFARDQKDQIT